MGFCRGLPPSAWDNDDICTGVKDLQVVRDTLEDNVESMEHHYKSVYLGMKGKSRPLADPATRDAWEKPDLEFIVHLDTNPRIEKPMAKSLFEQSMRFTSNTRELLWGILNMPIAAIK
jgi:hypothetical protein